MKPTFIAKAVHMHSKLIPPTDLSDEARQAVIAAINPLVADAFALFVKTKNYHWHVFGSHFRDLHKLFDEQAAQIFETIDVLAERVRKLGGITIHSISHIGQLQRVVDDNEDFVAPKEMVKRLMNDNQKCVASMRSAHQVCSEQNDVATASILEILIDETERRVWFLFEIQVEEK